MRILITLGPVTILELILFHTEAPVGPSVVVVHAREVDDDDDDEEKNGPGDMFGGGKS